MGVEYRCDKCSRMEHTIDRMGTIGIAFVPRSTSFTTTRMFKPRLWCEKCLDSVGIRISTFQVVVEQKASLEDLLRELVIDEIENAKGT